jgi:hypothetical protein
MQRPKFSLVSAWQNIAALDPLSKALGVLLIVLGIRPITDPDFGWHFRNGLDILARHTVPYLDPYSYTMPDWKWVNHEWLTDVAMALIYRALTPLGLSVIFGLIIALTFYIASGTHIKDIKLRLLGAVLGLLAALPIIGVRPQVLSLLGLAYVLYALYAYQRNERKHLWILLPVFAVWANLHGGFVMGLAAMALFFAVELFKYIVHRYWPKIYVRSGLASEPRLNLVQLRHLVLIGLSAGLVTLLNPYGLRLYYDIYLTLSNKFTIENITEWQAVNLGNAISYNYAFYIGVVGLLIVLAYRKVELTRLAIMGFFLYFSLLHWRNMPLFMVASAGLIAEIVAHHTRMVYEQLVRQRLTQILVISVVAVITVQQLTGVVTKSLHIDRSLQAAHYPIEAINWASAHPDQIGTRVFNEYGWGGLLIWKFPSQKVFQDGRMGYWMLDDRFPFFQSQLMLQAQPGTLELLDKYKVDWTLIMREQPLDYLLRGKKEKWKAVYADDTAVIYTRVK